MRAGAELSDRRTTVRDMRHQIPVVTDHHELRRDLGSGTYSRGLGYANAGRVLDWAWDGAGCTLTGTVQGSRRYVATVWFTPVQHQAEPAEFVSGRCTCPVAFDCKHVAALVIASLTDTVAAAERPGYGVLNWTQALDAALAVPATASRDVGSPLALALGIAPGDTADLSLSARLMRPGKKGWVAGELSWSTLSRPTHRQYDPTQVSLLEELYRSYQAGAASDLRSGAGYGDWYRYGRSSQERTIDLAEVGTRALRPLLTDLIAAGVLLIHAKSHTEIPAPVSATAELDIRSDGAGDAVVIPVLRVGEMASDWVPALFTRDGSGVVLTDPAARTHPDEQTWPVRLVYLDRAMPPGLASLFAAQGALRVPAAQVEDFRTGYVPRLRRVATLTSGDSSFALPDVSPPELVIHAGYETGHELELNWAWRYVLDGTPRLCQIEGQAGFRDAVAERAILDSLRGPLGTALPDEHGTPRRLRGLETMRFSTEFLPLLRDQPGVLVEIDGVVPDYREVGESLRIGLSTSEVPGQTDWFDLGITITVDEVGVPLREVFTALARDEDHLLLPDGGWFSLRKPQLQELRRLIEEARALQERPDGELRVSRYQAGLWEELRSIGVVEQQAAAWQRQVEGLLNLAELPAPAPPAGLVAELRPYQLTGFQWLTFLWEHGFGGVLGDDMGLGKTVQALALIAHARERVPGAPPFLIVAPTSVVSNWRSEAARFTPGLNTVAITDTMRRRGAQLGDMVAGADIVLTSYTLFRLDNDSYAAHDWSGLLLDEAQFVKNHRSQAHACARRLPAPFKVAMTGTPLENNLMELWALLSVGAPGLFPHATRFAESYARPIEGRVGTASGTIDKADRLATLRRRVRPLLLRRTKEQVAAELPPKQEQVLEVELGPRHRRVYDRHLARERQKVLGLLDDPDRNRLLIFRSLMLLRRLSLHAGLVDDEHAGLPSAKIDALVEHVHELVAGEHRTLVFSQFTGFLHLVRDRLTAEGIPTCYLDGRTRKRAEEVQRFRDGAAPVFLISLKAGGFGLNLTEADYCFLLDPWWNPAAEAQAIDRIHRIGQTRSVHVYRLIAANTIEAKVLALAARKAELFADVMGDDGAESFARGLSVSQVRALFE
jgi:superfamily II DNA or RNA helicase